VEAQVFLAALSQAGLLKAQLERKQPRKNAQPNLQRKKHDFVQ
jgi:hypothetical protein